MRNKVATPGREIPDGQFPSGITENPSGMLIRDDHRQESAVSNKVSGKMTIPDGNRRERIFLT
jgi:hypothetical protein